MCNPLCCYCQVITAKLSTYTVHKWAPFWTLKGHINETLRIINFQHNFLCNRPIGCNMKGRDGMVHGKWIQWKRQRGSMVRNSELNKCQGGTGGGSGQPRWMITSQSLPWISLPSPSCFLATEHLGHNIKNELYLLGLYAFVSWKSLMLEPETFYEECWTFRCNINKPEWHSRIFLWLEGLVPI